MCQHQNIILNEWGTSTCADCNVHFDKSLSHINDFENKRVLIPELKSQLLKNLEEIGINNQDVYRLVEKIFNITSKKKPLRGKNRKIIIAASLYYAHRYMGREMVFEDILKKLKLDRKEGSKGLRICQIAIQECKELEKELENLRDYTSFITLSYKESFQKLMFLYNIPEQKHYEIEEILIEIHRKKNKQLNNQITSLWVACIYFWVLKIRPRFEFEVFLTLNPHYLDRHKIQHELKFIQKHYMD
jgi:hypothetical protein